MNKEGSDVATIQYTVEDLKFLKERLERSYGEKLAKELMLEHKENLFGYRGLAWSLGKRDMYFFNYHFLKDLYVGDGKAELADVHYQIWESVEDMYVRNTHNQHVHLDPRGTGKTMIGSVSAAIWASVYKYSRFTVVASAVGETSESFMKTIKSFIKNDQRLKDGFGELYDPNLIDRGDMIELKNSTLIMSLSSRSSFRGKNYKGTRIELLILDDFQSEENVSNRDQMEKHWKKFSDDTAQAMQKDNYKMLAMGTIITRDDFYHKLYKLPTWKHNINKAIQVDDIDKLFNTGKWLEFKKILFDRELRDPISEAKKFYFVNEEQMQYPMLWDSYWDCLDMAMRYYENPISFKQEMQLDISSGHDMVKKFKKIHLLPEDEILQEGYRDILVVDPAGSETSKKGDYYAFVIGTQCEESKMMYVKKAMLRRFDFEEYVDFVISILEEYDNIDTIIIEKQTYNTADVVSIKDKLNDHGFLELNNYEFINLHQSKNKAEKISSIVGDVNNGKIWFNEEDDKNGTLDQLRDYINPDLSLHDDLPDALAEFVLYWKSDNLDEGKVQIITGNKYF